MRILQHGHIRADRRRRNSGVRSRPSFLQLTIRLTLREQILLLHGGLAVCRHDNDEPNVLRRRCSARSYGVEHQVHAHHRQCQLPNLLLHWHHGYQCGHHEAVHRPQSVPDQLFWHRRHHHRLWDNHHLPPILSLQRCCDGVWNSNHLLSMLSMIWWFLVSRTTGAACLEIGGQ